MPRVRSLARALAAAAAVLVVAAPLAALIVRGAAALEGDEVLHLARTVLPHQLGYSLLVSLGTALVALALASGGLAASVFVAPGGAALVRLGLVPLLVPPWYLAAIFHDALGLDDLPATILAEGVAASPLVLLLGGASLRTLARAHGDLLRVLGRSRFRAALSLLLPLARAPLFVAAGLVFLGAWGEATTPRLLGVPTVVVGLLDHWLARADDSMASLLAIGLALLASGPAVAVGLWFARSRFGAGAGLVARGPSLPLAGPERLLPIVLALPQLALGVLVPGWFLGAWTVSRLARVNLASLAGDLLHSLVLGAAGALFALLLALPLLPPRGRARGVIAASLWAAPLVAPPVLVGLAFLWLLPATGEGALAELVRAIDATPLPLALSFGVRWTGVFFGTLVAVYGGPARSHLDVLRTLGRVGPLEVLGALRSFAGPPLAGALAFVFLQVLADVPQTVLLQPFGFETLASRVFRYLSTQRLEDAAAWVLCLALAGLYPLFALGRAAGLGAADERH